ncbi:MAG: response regulator [candidate division KSB1 bacterium]|nr:response regulator [candidate division KSB1 bacterium]MDZ7295711.1 response regulator [candidate division KSB1 bacterium]MDZ7385916.1 response regulator [candidate division KSB1 bacterium]MDZ7392667.1 response regulator [candidate division KSB1 bacterium]MDZ7412935.1 response regulator [candidate division KSB1 bacterium]
MEKLKVLCIDDQREVLAALRKDLEPLSAVCAFVECESAAEAEEVLAEMERTGDHLALIICDHIMPGKNGIDLLAELTQAGRFSETKKLLLTGLATHEDTIYAINEAHIDRYVEKPWDPAQLQQAVRILLSTYLVRSGLDYGPYIELLGQADRSQRQGQ